MNAHLQELLQDYYQKLQKELAEIDGRPKILIPFLEGFQTNLLESTSQSIRCYLIEQVGAIFIDKSDLSVEHKRHFLSLRESRESKKILDLFLIGKNVKIHQHQFLRKLKNSKLLSKDLANTALSQLEKLRIFLDERFVPLQEDIVYLIKNFFSIGYSCLKEYLKKLFTKYLRPEDSLYSILHESIIAAGLGDIYNYMYLIAVNGEQKIAKYIFNEEKAKHIMKTINDKRFENETPLAIAANLSLSVENGEAFALKTFQAKSDFFCSLLEAQYRETKPKMFLAEHTIYGGHKTWQSLLFEKGSQGIVVMYPDRYAERIKRFLKIYGGDVIGKWYAAVKKTFKDWIRSFFNGVKKKLTNEKFRGHLKLFAELVKDGYEIAKPFLGNHANP